MFKDYSDGFIALNGRNKIRSSRKKSVSIAKEFIPATKLMWKAIGAMLLVTLVIGISSTIWYGMQVQIALDQISQNKELNKTFQNENRLLIAQRDLMLTQEQMEAAARKLGLQTPAKNQLRYP